MRAAMSRAGALMTALPEPAVILGRFLSQITVVLTLMALATALAEASQSIRGRITRVVDGDTVILSVGSDEYNIRLADIDAPESCGKQGGCPTRRPQPGGEEAKGVLREIALGREAVAYCRGASYDRTVCYVRADLPSGVVDLSAEMASRGMAWWEPRYGKSEAIRKAAESARTNRRGLWGSANPVEPRVWRDECWKQGICQGAERTL